LKMRVLTSGLLLVCGALALALVAARAGRQTVAAPPVIPAQATLPASLRASLPAGEIQAVSEQNGVHVVVVRPAAPYPVSESAAAEGQRAFKDPVTGRFREATSDDHQALQAKAASERRVIRRADPVERASETPGGGFYLEVPDSLTVYSLAQRAGDGSIVVGHAQGGEAAVSVARAPVRPASGKESRDVR
jgi:hypothetical protein